MPVSKGLLKLDIHSFWHPGTGRGDGASADAVVHTDETGLPVLPGRTVKGLLRAAHVLWSAERSLPPSRGTSFLFGSPIPAVAHSDERVARLEEARFRTEAGHIRVGNASLGRTAEDRAAWSRYAARALTAEDATARGTLALLKRSFASTKLDDEGVAADSTLRTIEVFVPMTLHAPLEITGDDSKALLAELGEAAALFLRAIGSHRNRGLGRCTASIEEVTHA